MPATLISPQLGLVTLGPTMPFTVRWAYDPADGVVGRTEFYISTVQSGHTDVVDFEDPTGALRSADVPQLELGKVYYIELWYNILGTWSKIAGIFGLGAVVAVQPTPTPQVGASRLDLDDRLMAAFVATWQTCTPPSPLVAMPKVVAAGSSWRPSNQEPYVQVDVLMGAGDEWGPVGTKNYDLTGTVQVSVYVKDGDGMALSTSLIKLVDATLLQIRGFVQGLNMYGCRKPYELPAPPPGYYGRGIDVPARYAGP